MLNNGTGDASKNAFHNRNCHTYEEKGLKTKLRTHLGQDELPAPLPYLIQHEAVEVDLIVKALVLLGNSIQDTGGDTHTAPAAAIFSPEVNLTFLPLLHVYSVLFPIVLYFIMIFVLTVH
jgi:hypothetical protein